MQTYSKFRPTQFDSAGAFLPDQADWLVVPCGQNRDSGQLDQSNFAAALALLGGESEDVEVHSFNHWACGWFEIIIVRPGTLAADLAETIEGRLEDYPVLDEEDLSSREWEAYIESWNSYAKRDFLMALGREFNLRYSAALWLETADSDDLREFYRNYSPYEYETHDDGPHIDVDRAAKQVPRDALAAFLRKLRAA